MKAFFSRKLVGPSSALILIVHHSSESSQGYIARRNGRFVHGKAESSSVHAACSHDVDHTFLT